MRSKPLRKRKKKFQQKRVIIKKKWINKNKLKIKKKMKKIGKRQQLRIINKSIYLITLTYLRRNIFLVASNLKGEVKVCLTSGQCGFKGKNKVIPIAVTETTRLFLQLVWLKGIRRIIIKYKGYNKIKRSFRRSFLDYQKKRKFNVLAFFIISHRAFNGCRQKKRRRL